LFLESSAQLIAFVVDAAAKGGETSTLLLAIEGLAVSVLGITQCLLPVEQLRGRNHEGLELRQLLEPQIDVCLSALFFLYVGTENAFGG